MKLQPRRRYLMMLLSVIGASVGMSSGANAEDVLRVSVPHLPPYADIRPDNSAKGLLPDLFAAIAEKMGIKVTISVVPLPRVIYELQNSASDAAILIQNATMEEVAERVSELPSRALQSIIIAKAGLPLRSYHDLEGKMLGIPRSVTGDSAFMKNEQIKKYEFLTYKQGAKMLKSDRIDAIDGTYLALYAALKAEGFTPAELGEPLMIQGHPAFVYFSKKAGQPALFEALKAACAELIQDGTFARIEQRYWDCFIEQKNCEHLDD